MPKPPVPKRQTFVQTERSAHVAWSRLAMENKTASAIMHRLVSLMDRTAAVAISYTTLATILQVNERTIRRSVNYLKDRNWLQVVQLGQHGTVNVYVINDRVAWADRRDNLRLSRFSAVIVANAEEQDAATLATEQLLKVPVIYPPERALPIGDWPEGSQAQLPGFEAGPEGWPDEFEDDLPFVGDNHERNL